ncbi:hypothetical protein SMQE32_26740 [Serratia marcescens]|uniref:hypothetical protein n=1 Tax=Serratia marcescens TaxID=615 RepID=UPI00066AEB4B|nr:hypothetical protein [Serratia marcescens]BEO71855.1 hypothetical protein SMQE32_26740 [Serratia marcescens]HAX9713962.1 hypothetical protein [Serratia marcescens]HEJ7904335.1 hypothetical protein [Serratia marcescens]
MSEQLKRFHGASFTDSELEGSKVLNSYIYSTDKNGEIDGNSEQEHVRWLISKENMENLYAMLKVALGKAN